MAAIMTACGHGIPGAMLRKIWGMVVITDRFDRFLWPRTTFDCGRSCRGTPPSLKACGEVPAQQGTLTLRHISGAPIQNYRRLGKSAAPRCCGLASRRAQRTRVFQILLVRLAPIRACTPPPLPATPCCVIHVAVAAARMYQQTQASMGIPPWEIAGFALPPSATESCNQRGRLRGARHCVANRTLRSAV